MMGHRRHPFQAENTHPVGRPRVGSCAEVNGGLLSRVSVGISSGSPGNLSATPAPNHPTLSERL